MEKDVFLKNILIIIMFLLLPVLFLNQEKLKTKTVFLEEKNITTVVNELIKKNEDKKLTQNKNYKEFIYLEFNENESYFIDNKTKELETLDNYALDKEKFNNLINELLDLKYPKFVLEGLKDKEKKYLLKEDLIINFNSDILGSEKISLTVNYKEIKELFKFKMVESSTQREDGYNYQKNKKTIAFTFDDGPSGNYTKEIVDILKENKAHATFFMVGSKMENGYEEIKKVIDNGNEVGSHSYNHKNMARMKLKEILESEEKTKNTYKKLTGLDIIYTRPPYGNINKKIKDSLDTIFITWSIDPEDWLHQDKDYIVNHILENVSDGDIILMHDLYQSTVDAVREVLPILYKKGYQVVSVSKLAEIKNINLEKHSLYRYLK